MALPLDSDAPARRPSQQLAYTELRIPVPAKVKEALEERVRKGEAPTLAALLHPVAAAQ